LLTYAHPWTEELLNSIARTWKTEGLNQLDWCKEWSIAGSKVDYVVHISYDLKSTYVLDNVISELWTP
jgi:hypothetical protein